MAANDRVTAVLAQIVDQDVVDLARDLVRIPSITGNEGREISRRMVAWLRDAGLPAGEQEITPERANVWARLDGEAPGPRLLLNGHLDTKPVVTMTVDPFGGDLREGRLYGRGACDMKSALAAAMVATRAVARSGIPIHGTLIFGSEVGEDGGGWRLADLLDGPGACDLMICCEPTRMALHIGARGAFPIDVTTTGRATHTGTAYQGVNAIEKMATVIREMYALPCFHRVDPIWGRSPINAQEIRGGGKVTASVADECTTIFDIRLNPDLSPDRMEETVEALFSRLRAADPELKISRSFRSFGSGPGLGFVGVRPAQHIPADHALVVDVLDAAEAAIGVRPGLGGFPGGCSASVTLARGTPSVVFGPGDLEQAHSADEWIEVEQVLTAARVYAAAIARVLAPR